MEMILRLQRIGDAYLRRSIPIVPQAIDLLRRSDDGRMVSATVATLILRALVMASQVGVFALAARGLEMADVGIYALINTLWTLWRQLGPLGFDQLALRVTPAYLAAGRSDLASAANRFARRVVLLFSLLLALLTVVGILAVGGSVVRGSAVMALALLCAGMPPHAAIGLFAGQIRARERLAASLLPEAIVVQPGLLLIALAMWWEDRLSLEGLLLSQIALACLSVGLYFALGRGTASRSDVLSPKERAQHLRTAGEIFVSLLVTGLYSRMANIVVAATLGPQAVAIMEAALRIALVPSQIVWAVSIAVAQAMSRAIAIYDRPQLEKLTSLASLLGFVPAAVYLVAVLLIGGEVIKLIFGSSFLPAYWPAVFLCAGTAVNAKYTPASQVFLLSGGQRLVLGFTLVALATVLIGILGGSLFTDDPTTGVTAASAAMLVGASIRDIGLHLTLNRRMAALFSRDAEHRSLTGCAPE